jgi:predicted nucleic acid-binding protein
MSTSPRPALVLDADATIALAERDAITRLSQRWTLVAPPLLRIEVCNALHRALARRRATTGPELAVFQRIVDAPIETISSFAPNAPWDIADLLGWQKTYDAEYLAVARRLGAGIFTLDQQLATGAQRLGIELVIPA